MSIERKLTRTTTQTHYEGPPDIEETETGSVTSVSSVELKEDAKGNVHVEGYKVYSNDPAEAERLAFEGMVRLKARIQEQFDAKVAEALKQGAK